jgi:hypothetical protein
VALAIVPTGFAMPSQVAQARHHAVRRRRYVVGLSVCLACVSLAGLSLLIPSAPTTDSWGWVLWGREITSLEFSTKLGGSPAWKPLPVFLTTPLSLAGEAAPTLWILLARSLALAGLLLAFLLAGRLVDDRSVWLRSAAGAIAVIGLLLSRSWLKQFWHGYSEPIALALLLAAIERHLSGRRGQALLLGAAVATVRPEAFVLVAAYGALLVWRREANRGLVVAVLVAVPAAWLVPDWVGAGDPFYGSNLASGVIGSRENQRPVFDIGPVPLLVAALAGTALALFRRDRTFLVVAGLGLAWYAALGLMMTLGYPQASRLFYVPAGLLCVAGAAALVQLVTQPGLAWIRASLAAAALAVLTVSFVPRVASVVEVAERSATRAQIQSDLSHAVTRAGGADLSRCGPAAIPRGFRWMKGMVSWRLGVPLREVHNLRTRGSRRLAKTLAHGIERQLPGTGGRRWGRAVTVVVPRKPVVLFMPFKGVRIKAAGHRGRPRIERLGSHGQWFVATSDPSGCRAELSRTAT